LNFESSSLVTDVIEGTHGNEMFLYEL